MLWCKVVIVKESHFEDSVVNTDAHVGNSNTGYDLKQQIKQNTQAAVYNK